MNYLTDSLKVIIVPLGHACFSKNSQNILKTFALGSCLGLSFYEPTKKWGGLMHIVLPDSLTDPPKANLQPYYFVDTALDNLIKLSEHEGFSLASCQIKVAGGSSMNNRDTEKSPTPPSYEIGSRNIEALEISLRKYNLNLNARHLGDHMSRNMSLELETGTVRVYNTQHSWIL